MKKEEFLEKAHAVIVSICLGAMIVSALVVGLPYVMNFINGSSLDFINVRPPYRFTKTDGLLQSAIQRLEQRGLTQGEIDPYFHRYGDLQEYYCLLKNTQTKTYQLALAYPDSADISYEFSENFQQEVKPILQKVSARNGPITVGIYDLYHSKKGWGILFFVSILGVAYGSIYLLKR